MGEFVIKTIFIIMKLPFIGIGMVWWLISSGFEIGWLAAAYMYECAD